MPGRFVSASSPLTHSKPARFRNSGLPLAVAWVHVLVAFQKFFSPAPILTAIFALQGVLLLTEVVSPHLAFGFAGDAFSYGGIVLIGYALIYPLVGLLFGHAYPRMALSTLFPCPLVVFTFGLLLTSQKKIPKYLLAIPLFWSMSGFYWVIFGMREDIGLVAAGILGAWLIWRRERRIPVTDRAQEAASQAG